MIKKIFHILFSAWLLATVVGVSLNKHYCGGHLKSVTLIVTDDCGDMDMPIDCCQDVAQLFQLDADFHKATFDFNFIAPLQFLFVVFHEITNLLFSQKVAIISDYQKYSPPLIAQNIILLVQSFRI